MNADTTCGTCKFYCRLQGKEGQCRFAPPQGGYHTAVNKLNNQPVPLPFSFWPPVQSDQWCGRFELSFVVAEN